jgi:hypothetical protein
MYESEYRFALENAGFSGFRVLLFQQSRDVTKQDQEPGLKYTADLGFGMLNAIVRGDQPLQGHDPDLRRPLRPLVRYPGVAGTAANLVLALLKRSS